MSAATQASAKKNENFLKLQQTLMVKSTLDESCILNQALTLIANKWTLLILEALMQGTKRNSELLRQIKGISPKMLTQTLKTLMEYNMVKRSVYPEVPPRVEYELTEFGESTADPLIALLQWSIDWEDQISNLYNARLKFT